MIKKIYSLFFIFVFVNQSLYCMDEFHKKQVAFLTQIAKVMDEAGKTNQDPRTAGDRFLREQFSVFKNNNPYLAWDYNNETLFKAFKQAIFSTASPVPSRP